MPILRSALLDAFPHGFTTRQGGVSPAPWDSLNLGGAVGDAPERVAENWRRLEADTGLGFARVRQVHGARAVRADRPCAPVEEADAVVSLRPGVAACVSVADCVPVLLADPGSGAVAAVHAGWRGTLARAAAEGVRALAREAGAPPGAAARGGRSVDRPLLLRGFGGPGRALPARARGGGPGIGASPASTSGPPTGGCSRRRASAPGASRSWGAAPPASATSSSPTGATRGRPVGRSAFIAPPPPTSAAGVA